MPSDTHLLEKLITVGIVGYTTVTLIVKRTLISSHRMFIMQMPSHLLDHLLEEIHLINWHIKHKSV